MCPKCKKREMTLIVREIFVEEKPYHNGIWRCTCGYTHVAGRLELED